MTYQEISYQLRTFISDLKDCEKLSLDIKEFEKTTSEMIDNHLKICEEFDSDIANKLKECINVSFYELEDYLKDVFNIIQCKDEFETLIRIEGKINVKNEEDIFYGQYVDVGDKGVQDSKYIKWNSLFTKGDLEEDFKYDSYAMWALNKIITRLYEFTDNLSQKDRTKCIPFKNFMNTGKMICASVEKYIKILINPIFWILSAHRDFFGMEVCIIQREEMKKIINRLKKKIEEHKSSMQVYKLKPTKKINETKNG